MCQFRVVDGKVCKGDTVVMMNTGKEYTLDEIGVLAPVKIPVGIDCVLEIHRAPFRLLFHLRPPWCLCLPLGEIASGYTGTFAYVKVT